MFCFFFISVYVSLNIWLCCFVCPPLFLRLLLSGYIFYLCVSLCLCFFTSLSLCLCLFKYLTLLHCLSASVSLSLGLSIFLLSMSLSPCVFPSFFCLCLYMWHSPSLISSLYNSVSPQLTRCLCILLSFSVSLSLSLTLALYPFLLYSPAFLPTNQRWSGEGGGGGGGGGLRLANWREQRIS